MYVNESFFRNLDSYLSQIERTVNYSEYLFGGYTGPYRILVGKVMMLAFSVFAVGHLIVYAWEPERNIEQLRQARQYGGYVVHATLNVLRGLVATHTLSGGIFLLLTYDLSRHRFHYFFEELQEGEHTVNPSHPKFPFNKEEKKSEIL